MGQWNNETGAAMFVAMALLVMISLLGLSAVQMTSTDMSITENFQQDTRSFYVAEGGVEHAYGILRDTASWRTGLSNQSVGGGMYNVTITDEATQPALLDTLVFVSSSERSGARSTIEVKFAPTRPFRWAAFADDHMDLNGGTYTDSYDSDSGTYAATMLLEGGDVGSNGYVDISGTADINGDAGTASAGDLSIGGAGVVSGDTTTTAPMQVFDPVTVADIDYAEANNTAPGGLSGTYNFNAGNKSLRVNPGNTLTLADGMYYFSSMDISGDIVIPAGSTVKIYIDGDIQVQSMAKINVAGIPIQCQIYSRGSLIRINGGAEIRSVVYAPDTEIRLTGGGDLYGAYVGNVATDNGGSNFHYDRSLGDFELEKHYSKVAWREM
jgi:hypothetical protein